jgi:uncharacterized protein YkwD
VFRIAAALALLGFAGCASETPQPTAQPTFYRNLAEGEQLDPAAAQSMISGYRANNGLGAVALDPELMRQAEEHSRTMASRDKVENNISKRAKDSKKASAENVSAGYHTLAEAFSGWRDSPPHRATMLNKDATRMGIAAVYSPKSKYKVFWTLILAPG